MKRVIVHFQEKLQKRLCCSGRSENVTLDREKVTCRNCLDLLKRKKFNASINWDAMYRSLGEHLPAIKHKLLSFGFEHPWCNYDFGLGNMPPRLWFEFWLPPLKSDKRRKTVGVDRQAPESWTMGNVVHVYVPKEDEMGIIATFVGSLSEELHLTPRRTDRESAILCYELKVDYEKFKMKSA